MTQRRTLILVSAILVGMISTFLIYNYVDGVKQDALGDVKQVEVYMVKAAVKRGASGEEARTVIVKENMPQKFKPANAIANLDDLTGKVAAVDLVPNQIVVAEMFVDMSDPSARVSSADRLRRIRDTDQVAITIAVDQIRGVAGLVQPGDYVNIMLTDATAAPVDAEGNVVAQTEAPKILLPGDARYLYQKAEVLAIDKAFVPQSGEAEADPAAAGAANAGLITLIVPTKAAQYVASVRPEDIYLTLVGRDYKPEAQTDIDKTKPLPAEDTTVLTPYGPEGPDNAS